jgi:carbon storage regulator
MIYPSEEKPVLILTRKADQSIIINDDIVVTVLEIKGKQVRIGIDAPKDITILRNEVAEKDKQPE